MTRDLRQSLTASMAAVILVACTGENPSDPERLGIEAATAAVVNDRPIYIVDVELEAVSQGLTEPGEPFLPNHPDFRTVLDQMIDQALLAQEAENRGLHIDPNARRRLEAARERVLGNLLVESLVAREVTEERIRTMYQEQAALQQIDDEVNLRHILLVTEEDARQAYDRVVAGEDFTTVAFDMSIDTRSRIEGGALGYVEPNRMGEPFASEIANTPTGEVSQPFASDQGWHVIKVEERRTPPPKTLEEMRPEIVTFLTYTEISKILRALRGEAVIETSSGAAPVPIGDEVSSENPPITPAAADDETAETGG